MTTNDERATALTRALRAAVERDAETLRALVTDDVRAWTPALSTASLTELLDELDRRGEAFADVQLEVVPLDVGGDFACVEWTAAMTHTGTLALSGDTTIEPTHERVVVHGATVAEFLGDRICSLRQYWNELDVLEQLGAISDDQP
jgi:ketosteroid isomerase-like protein